MTAKSEFYPPSIIDLIFENDGTLKTDSLPKDTFIKMTADYPELHMEREQNGRIVITGPLKGLEGFRENDLSFYVTLYSKQNKKGKVFSPSTGFDLPDGSTRSPDVAWVSDETLEKHKDLISEDSYLPIVPDFIIELRSKSDRLPKLRNKMSETWIANGVQLAWLIDPYEEKAYIYRADGSIQILVGFDKELDGENVLPEFRLKLEEFKLKEN